MKELKLEERLILPADFKPDLGGISEVRRKVLELAGSVEGTGVIIKVNSALRACGYSLIKELHDRGVKVMADLKLVDIAETMETDALIIAEYAPELLTVMCCAGIEGMRRVRYGVLSEMEVLGVTVLTSLNEEDCQAIFTCSTKAGVLRFARMAQLAGLNGLVLSPAELEVVRDRPELALTFNTPAIRPAWSVFVGGDDQNQNRVMTPAKAIEAGADRIVVGRPILGAKPNDKGLPNSPREAVERTIAEIAEGLTICEGRR